MEFPGVMPAIGFSIVTRRSLCGVVGSALERSGQTGILKEGSILEGMYGRGLS